VKNHQSTIESLNAPSERWIGTEVHVVPAPGSPRGCRGRVVDVRGQDAVSCDEHWTRVGVGTSDGHPPADRRVRPRHVALAHRARRYRLLAHVPACTTSRSVFLQLPTSAVDVTLLAFAAVRHVAAAAVNRRYLSARRSAANAPLRWNDRSEKRTNGQMFRRLRQTDRH